MAQRRHYTGNGGCGGMVSIVLIGVLLGVLAHFFPLY